MEHLSHRYSGDIELNNSIAHTVLDNGLTVITRESHKVPIASFWVWYRVGSRNEVPGTTGISHWVEHMMFKGTPTLSKGEIFRQVNANGGVLNGFTWLDYTAYFETLPSHRIGLALEIESDRMVNSLFQAEEVESERTVIISEREGSENSPTFLLAEEIGAAAFQAHPYGHSVIGWKSDLRSITRDDLFNHYQTYYTPNNAIVVAVGDFNTESLLEQIRERFGAIPAGPAVPSSPPGRAPAARRAASDCPPSGRGPPPGDRLPRARLLQPGRLPDDGSGRCPFRRETDGDVRLPRGTRMGRSSRLYRALVDGGLASGASSSFAATRDPYLFEIDATPRPDVSIEDLERAVFQEVENLQKFGVGPEEVTRAMKQVKAQFVYASESVTDQSYWLGAMEVLDSYETYGKIVERLEQVTPEDIKTGCGGVPHRERPDGGVVDPHRVHSRGVLARGEWYRPALLLLRPLQLRAAERDLWQRHPCSLPPNSQRGAAATESWCLRCRTPQRPR